MADLHPTKTRLALLAGIQAGEVTGYPVYDSDYVEYCWGSGANALTVTARVNEMLRQDPPWARKGRWVVEDRVFKVELTEAGQKVLEASRG